MTTFDDTPENLAFMVAFQNLQAAIGGKPETLQERAEADPAIAELCHKLCWAAWPIERAEGKLRERFVTPVNPTVVEAWRLYRDQYAKTVGLYLFDHESLRSFLESVAPAHSAPKLGLLDQLWQDADERAEEMASAMATLVSFAEEEASQDHRGFPEDFPDLIRKGGEAWSFLENQVGLDARGILRRRELVPVVRVPRHVAQRYGDSAGSISLFDLLHQAQDAYIRGVPFACFALLRSVLETMLRRHYGAAGDNLRELIEASRALPEGANKIALHKLRELANEVLHGGGRRTRFPKDMEKNLLWHFLVLRNLIESAPAN